MGRGRSGAPSPGTAARVMTWRLITQDGVGAAAGLAGDEVLAQRVGAGSSPPTLRLYTYRPHSALVGRFQNVANEVHVHYCQRHAIEMNRRPTGGGAILMGPDQLGVALALRGRGSTVPARTWMRRFSDGLVRGLASLGISASFRGKNDLEVGGRKIAGLGIYRDPSGGLLFHASLLVELDVALMTRVLRAPFAEVSAERIRRVGNRLATVRAVLGDDVPMDEVRRHVAGGFTRSFDVMLARGRFTDEERALGETLEREKYDTGAWVRWRSEVPDRTGAAIRDTPGGRVEVNVSLAGRMIKAVHLSGDFFETEEAVGDLEARLRWHVADADRVAATVGEWARARPRGTLAADSLAAAILTASDNARAVARDPYGCFVDPRT